MEILQSDNGTEFKGICLELVKRYGVKVINGRPRTPRTQGLVEQANGTVKARINAWKPTYGSSHWADSLEVYNLLQTLEYANIWLGDYAPAQLHILSIH